MDEDSLFNNFDNDGDGQDVCSWVSSLFSQRESTQQLVNWLRESQTNCEDTHCIDQITGLPLSDSNGPTLSSNDAFFNNLMLVMGVLLALLTFYHSRLTSKNLAIKNRNNNSGGDRNEDDDHQQHHSNNNNSEPELSS